MPWARASAILLAAMIGLTVIAAPGTAQAETRTLKLYFTHTKESAEITFKRNGRYVQSGLNKLNRFLRDHRRNEPTRMDPKLFDLVWEVYKASGARGPIHVVSAYRSPATNAMLRRTRGGQARKSQHTLGKAMDFFIPGVKTSKLRELGFKLQGGGVGYYPKSATPFVHLDTGSVRAWPRMSRSQLTRLFPDGKTLHLPPDGKPLPGYQQALAAYNARQRSGQAPTLGRSRSRSRDRDTERTSDGSNLLANLFGNRDNGGASDGGSQQASRPSAPSRRQAAPETPRTVLASISRRDLPRPNVAPRPRQDTGVPVAATPRASQPAVPAAAAPSSGVSLPRAIVPGIRAIVPGVNVGTSTPEPAPETAPAEVAPAFTPPVPQSRPTVLVASAEPPAIRRSANQIEASAAIESVARDEPSALLAAATTEPVQADPLTELASVLPLPAPAPRAAVFDAQTESDVPTTLAAYAPPAVEPMVPPQVADRPEQRVLTASIAPDGRGDRILIPAPRPEPADSPLAFAALNTGVNTTPKTARASRNDAIVAPAASVPVAPVYEVDPARFGDWTVSVASVTAEGRPVERPEFIKNATRTAPDAVYTAGFTKEARPDPNRLSGNAVTFLAVARFEGRGGDGQPLQLQIPATN